MKHRMTRDEVQSRLLANGYVVEFRTDNPKVAFDAYIALFDLIEESDSVGIDNNIENRCERFVFGIDKNKDGVISLVNRDLDEI